jgi:AhpD family alkylhydroperoxidase
MKMNTRVNHFETVPELINTLGEASMASHKSSLDAGIKNLVDIRASQLNGCAFCLDMHVKQAKLRGERTASLPRGYLARITAVQCQRESGAGANRSADPLGMQGVRMRFIATTREYFSDEEI